MPCYYPIDGWRAKSPNESGKYGVVFSRKGAQEDQPVKLPCGRCIGCRLARSKDWALRCMHEASMHEDNAFITLTFDDKNLPSDGSINPEHLQKFFRRLREKISPRKIKYFACGEYGEQLGRPHYHAIIFNHGFPDKEPMSQNGDNILFKSKSLEQTWPYGLHSIGTVTEQSAAYVARYSLKKINGEQSEEHYQGKRPEFLLSSKKPAIGKQWFEKYKDDCLKGYLTNNGKKVPVPKYYEKLWSESDDYSYSFYKAAKAEHIDIFDPENCNDRLRVKEQCKIIQTETLTRSL